MLIHPSIDPAYTRGWRDCMAGLEPSKADYARKDNYKVGWDDAARNVRRENVRQLSRKAKEISGRM